METNKTKKVKANHIVGLILCLICAILLILTIISVCESFAEKARLEAIGATVTIKITWLFVVDVVLIIIAGIIGGVFLSKKSSTDRVLTKEWDDKNVEDEEIATSGIIDAVGYDMKKVERFNVDDIVVEPDMSTSTTTNGTVAKSGKLKIKMSNNVSSVSVPTSEQAKIERKSTSATKSSEHSNGFFSAGDDL